MTLSTDERSPPPVLSIGHAARWREYRRHGDRALRDELILAHAPLVKQVAGGVAARLAPHVELAELVSYGLGGLITAVERFDPARGVKFESFAALRIRGAIYDGMRAMDWVPRSVREEGHGVRRATAALTTRLQRLPNDAELAGELSLDADQLDDVLLRVETTHVAALDHPRRFDAESAKSFTLLDGLVDRAATDPAAAATDGELRDRVAAAVQQLSGREQTVLALRYHQELTHLEIGEVLQVSESRVCQIHAKAIIGLRVLLDDPAAPLS